MWHLDCTLSLSLCAPVFPPEPDGDPKSWYVRPLSGTFWLGDDALGALASAALMGGSTGLEGCSMGCPFPSLLSLSTGTY